MASNMVDLRPVLASLSRHSVSDVRVRKCPETGKIFLRFKVYGKFAPSVFDECQVKLVLVKTQISGVIRIMQSEVVRGLVYLFEFQANDPAQINALNFLGDLVQWSNVQGVRFTLDDAVYYQPNPFFRMD